MHEWIQVFLERAVLPGLMRVGQLLFLTKTNCDSVDPLPLLLLTCSLQLAILHVGGAPRAARCAVASLSQLIRFGVPDIELG